MAEPLGLLPFAFQLGEGAVKMKRLYRSYKEAPKRLKDLSESLETLACILRRLEQDRQRCKDVDRTAMDRCIQSCIRVATDVCATVHKHESAVKKSKVKGQLSTALGQAAIVELCDDLERAKSSLVLAHLLYSRECEESDRDRVQEQVSRNTAMLLQLQTAISVSQFANEGNFNADSNRQLISPRLAEDRACLDTMQRRRATAVGTSWQQQTRKKRRIRLAPWFTARVWEITYSISQTGFDFSFRTCNFVESDALIFEVCRGGSIAEVQALFQSGEASPFDCSYDSAPLGSTVLGAAAKSGNLQLCRYLVEIAGFPVLPDHCEDILSTYARSFSTNRFAPQDAVEMYRLLLKRPGWDVDKLITGRDSSGKKVACPWWWACPDAACVKVIRDEFLFDFTALIWEAQLDLAMSNCGSREEDMPLMFLSMLGHVAVSPQIAQSCNDHGHTALHMVARQLSWSCITLSPTWIDFVRQLLQCGADIHYQTDTGDTPFAYLLHTSWDEVSVRVQTWANLLDAAGIDLTVYGRREKAMWSEIKPIESNSLRYGIIGWTYGACADDWAIEYSHEGRITIPIYEAKMECWPGAWPGGDQYKIHVICWRPEEEDYPTGPCHWSKVREVKLCRTSSPYELREKDDGEYERELSGVQDDCGPIVRLIRNSSRSCSRLRSCSQPPSRVSWSVHTYRPWLPRCHRCLCNGRIKFPVGDRYGPSDRRCAKELHYEYPCNRDDYQKNIRQQMRRFQTRFLHRDDLRALPYAAYHYNYKGNQEPIL